MTTSKIHKGIIIVPNINVFNTIDEEIEVIRKCTNQEATESSWNNSCYVSFDNSNVDFNETHFKSVTMTPTADEASLLASVSTQTEKRHNEFKNVFNNINISFNNDFSFQDSLSDNSECAKNGYKRNRSNIDVDDNLLYKLHKKSKCIESTSSAYGLRSDIISDLSSASEVSFKSVNSNNSLRIKKRRNKSNSNLFRDIFQKSKKNKSNYLDNNTPSDTPRKERSRRTVKNKAWKFMDLCAWIGMKGLKSFSSLSGLIREPAVGHNSDKQVYGLIEEIRSIKEIVAEFKTDQLLWEREKNVLKDEMQKMTKEIRELKDKIRNLENQPKLVASCIAPPPPPPPPPPPLPPFQPAPQQQSKLGRSNTIPRCGSAPPRISGPRLTITPEDIANVKLRKTRANSVRAHSFKEGQQPLVTEQMLVSTRAKLGRTRRPVAASTPSAAPANKQLSDLEKCLLQEPLRMSSLHQHRSIRSSAFRSAEELRMRPYPSRSPRSSHSPRAKSIPRVKSNISSLELTDFSTSESSNLR